MVKNWKTILEALKETQKRLNLKDTEWHLTDEAIELAAKGWAIILAGPEHPKFQEFTGLLHRAY